MVAKFKSIHDYERAWIHYYPAFSFTGTKSGTTVRHKKYQERCKNDIFYAIFKTVENIFFLSHPTKVSKKI
jgi:hypothetical protein